MVPPAPPILEGFESKPLPSPKSCPNDTLVQVSGTKKARGPLKFCAFKNKVQQLLPMTWGLVFDAVKGRDK